MAAEFVAVDGLVLDHDASSPVSGGVFTLVSTPSTKVKADGQGVFFGSLLYTFTGGDASGFDPSSVISLPPPATNSKIDPTSTALGSEGAKAIRANDTGVMVAQGTVSGTPTPVPGPVTVIVSDAGQDKVKAE